MLRLERGKGPGDQDYQTRYNGTATIEIVSTIEPYGVVPLEKLMRERNLHVTRSLHPMMSVSFDRRIPSKRLHWKRKFLSGIQKNQRSNQNP